MQPLTQAQIVSNLFNLVNTCSYPCHLGLDRVQLKTKELLGASALSTHRSPSHYPQQQEALYS